jgi:plasmid stability protein
MCRILQADCEHVGMRTLYLRNVPDDVVARLESLAERHGMSVSALALRELTEASRRADNPRLLAELPDLGIPTSTIVGALDVDRAAR